MPQITSCPDCSKKLRVPDELIGKKVKCPGCATMFIAEGEVVDEEPPAPPPPPKRRSDAVRSGPRSGARPREEEERPRARRDAEEDSGERRVRSRRDDEDRRPSRRDDEEDDRPRRDRRDDYDDYDDRPRGRRDDYDDRPSPREEREGWRKVRMGLNFVAISGWIAMGIMGLYVIIAGVLLLFGGAVVGAFMGGNAGGAAGGLGAMGIVMCGMGVIIGLLGLASTALMLTGTGMCMAVPRYFGTSMKGLAIAAFSCLAAGVALTFLGAGTVYTAIGAGGLYAYGTGGLVLFAGHILWMIVVRLFCLHFRDQALAKTVLTNLIVQIVAPFVWGFLYFILLMIVGVSLVSSRTGSGAASAAGFGFAMVAIFMVASLIVFCVIWIWYLMTLQKVRDLVEYEVDRM